MHCLELKYTTIGRSWYNVTRSSRLSRLERCCPVVWRPRLTEIDDPLLELVEALLLPPREGYARFRRLDDAFEHPSPKVSDPLALVLDLVRETRGESEGDAKVGKPRRHDTPRTTGGLVEFLEGGAGGG